VPHGGQAWVFEKDVLPFCFTTDLRSVQNDPLHIGVRLPNWLGDMVMALPFLHVLQQAFPAAAVSVVAKQGLHDLLPLFPPTKHRFQFDKRRHKGPLGAWRFGRELRASGPFDLFFSLPDSFSAALMAWGTGARKRVGFRNEGRSLLLTHAYEKPTGGHRAETYLSLLERFTEQALPLQPVRLQHGYRKEGHVVVNINSEAQSRRLTERKAVELLGALRAAVPNTIVLIGAPKEVPFLHGVLKKFPEGAFQNKAGTTTLPQLAALLASAEVVLTTDSGPAHLANALGTHTIVLFGAGNEGETAPYNKEARTIIRLNRLSCEPCQKNVCTRYGEPQCLEQLDTAWIVATAVAQLNNQPT
jgi:ADP-heptose:LPS heptosyltransferase